MIERFHEAGIKVILDVVYNHTAEGDQRGPTLCYRGLDNASYYRLISGQPRYYVNDTGCGNTVNVANPHVLRMVLDSLRFWVQNMGVDGFRFDLATTLGREDHGFDRHGGFFDAIRQDPVLCDVRLIAEPWDMGPGGYRLGDFPTPFSEWNDGFRDNVRKYWRGDHHSAQELGARLLGSAGEFDRDGRPAWSSVNFITAHDGFTLADLTSYNNRHNHANGENGADGHAHNLSDNCGVEGPTDDTAIQEKRAKRRRNLLATLMLSQGTPMILAGDELENSQYGNNNAYCQDNEIGWVDWSKTDAEFKKFVAMLSQFRSEHKVLRQSHFLHGGVRSSDQLPDVEWRSLTGSNLDWRDPGLSSFCLLLRCSAEASSMDNDTVFLVFNRGTDSELHLPNAPHEHHWVRAIDTAVPDYKSSNIVEPGRVTISAESVVAFAARHNSDGRWA
jgi:glycogen operon protein